MQWKSKESARYSIWSFCGDLGKAEFPKGFEEPFSVWEVASIRLVFPLGAGQAATTVWRCLERLGPFWHRVWLVKCILPLPFQAIGTTAFMHHRRYFGASAHVSSPITMYICRSTNRYEPHSAPFGVWWLRFSIRKRKVVDLTGMERRKGMNMDCGKFHL